MTFTCAPVGGRVLVVLLAILVPVLANATCGWFLLMPTTPQKAQPLPDPADGVAEWCRRASEMFANTCPFDVTHHPALSLPCGMSDGLPVGLMLVGRHFDEATLYRVGQAYELA